MAKQSFKYIYLMAIYLFLYIPIALLIAFSFNDAQFSMVWRGFTTRWYGEVVNDSNLWIAAWHSLILAVASTTTALVIGTLAAVSFCRFSFPGKKLLISQLFFIIITPDIVLGIALLILFSFLTLPLGFWSLYLSHVTFCIPFVFTIIYARAKGIDKNIFIAAKDLGADELQIFTKITLPMLMPAIISSALLSFTLSIDDIVISYFVSGPSFEILPIKIYSLARLGVDPELNALCSLLFGLTVFTVTISYWITQRKEI